MTVRREEATPAGTRPSLPLSHRVVLLDGWPRRLFAFATGACGALAMAPLGLVPAMAVSLVSAVWLLDGAARVGVGRDGRRRHARPTLVSAFGIGWWWGFGYFIAGLYWLGSAFLVEPADFAWALPLGVIGLPAVLGIYTGLAFAVARSVWMPGAGRVVVLALALLGCEWLRGVLFTGFPWNDLGMTLGTNLVLAQVASVVGLHGLTVLTVLIFAGARDTGRPAARPPLARSDDRRRRGASRARGLRGRPARDGAGRQRARRQTAHHAARRLRRRRVQLREPEGTAQDLPGAVRPCDLRGDRRPRRRHASDLAREPVPVHPVPRPRCARCDRGGAAEGRRSHHRRGTRRRQPGRRRRPAALLQLHSGGGERRFHRGDL